MMNLIMKKVMMKKIYEKPIMTITIIQTRYRDGRIMNTPTSITLPTDSLEDYRATILASDPDITSVLFTYDSP